MTDMVSRRGLLQAATALGISTVAGRLDSVEAQAQEARGGRGWAQNTVYCGRICQDLGIRQFPPISNGNCRKSQACWHNFSTRWELNRRILSAPRREARSRSSLRRVIHSGHEHWFWPPLLFNLFLFRRTALPLRPTRSISRTDLVLRRRSMRSTFTTK